MKPLEKNKLIIENHKKSLKNYLGVNSKINRFLKLKKNKRYIPKNFCYLCGNNKGLTVFLKVCRKCLKDFSNNLLEKN